MFRRVAGLMVALLTLAPLAMAGPVTYLIDVRDSTVSAGSENRKTGLSPGFCVFKLSTDSATPTGIYTTGAPYVSGGLTAPTVTEVGNGLYRFSYDAATNGEVDYQIDCGSTLSSYSDRFLSGHLSADSVKIITNLDANVGSRGTSNLTQPQVTGGNYPITTDPGGNVKVSVGTGAGQINLSNGIAPSNLQLIAGQTVSASAGVTFPSAISSLTAAQAATAFWSDAFTSSDFSTAGSAGAWAKANVAQSGDAFARLGAPAGASTSADIASLLTAVNGLPGVLMGTVVDGTVTLKQAQEIALGMSLEATRIVNTANATSTISGTSVPAHTAIATWYRRMTGSTSPDYTKPLVVKTTTYAADNVQVISQTFTITNL